VDITTELLRRRLAGTELKQDPTEVMMPLGSEHWPRELREALPKTLTPAGVLIPLIERREGPSVLLTQRSAELTHHAGQISFPGGRMEASDADIEATALRETYEEVGIEPQHVRVFGSLDAMPTITGYAVTAVVGAISTQAELRVDRSEVEEVFEVPLEFLIDRHNARAGEREYMGRKLPVVEFHYAGHRIWGATAHMILQLRNIILKE
jgi:8-oxo-dGTP pyrophosphatase MutT (NUDIX family)